MPYSGVASAPDVETFLFSTYMGLCHTLFYREQASPSRLETLNVDPVKQHILDIYWHSDLADGSSSQVKTKKRKSFCQSIPFSGLPDDHELC